MKITLLFILFPLFLFGQTQIGNDLDGKIQGDQLGWSTAISKDGSIVAVGASGISDRIGYVQVFKNENGTWTQLGNDIIGETSSELFGHAISLSDDGTIIAISAPKKSNSNDQITGIVKVYKFENNNWVQKGTTLTGDIIEQNQTGIPQNNTEFGYSISLNSDGSLIAIGAPKADFTCHSCTWILNCGQTILFKFQNNDWEGINTIYGETEEDNSGNSVSLSSNGLTLAIGASNNDGNGNNSGHVRIYKNVNSSWVLSGEEINGSKDIDGEAAYDLSGFSVSISGDGTKLAIGAIANDGNDGSDIDSGHVRLYSHDGSDLSVNTRWFSYWNDIDGESSVDQFGYSVSLSDNGLYLAAGSIDNDGNGSKSGHVRVFKMGTRREQLGIDIDGEASGDQSGFSVSISGDGTKVAIGAPFNDGNGSNSGHVRVYDLSAVLSLDSSILNKISITPNPAKNLVSIQLNENLILKNISIYNSLGQFIKSTKKLNINTSDLTSGFYYIEIETNKGKSSKKLIIE